MSEELTPAELERLRVLLGNPLFFPDVFKDFVLEKVRNELGAKLPLEQIRKSNVLFGQYHTFGNLSGNFSNGNWVNTGTPSFLTVPGPSKALAFWTASVGHLDANTDGIFIAVNVNGAADDLSGSLPFRRHQATVDGGRAKLIDLPEESNTVRLRVIKFGSASYSVSSMHLILFRIPL